MKSVIIGTGFGFGDVLMALPLAKEYHERGYKSILALNSKWSDFFKEIPYINDVIPIVPRIDVTNGWSGCESDYTNISQIITNYIQRKVDDEVVLAYTYRYLPIWVETFKRMSYEVIQPLERDTNNIRSRTYEALIDGGLGSGDPINIDISFQRTNHKIDPTKFNIGVCFGSPDATRRFSPYKIKEIVNKLDGKVFILGGASKEEVKILEKSNAEFFDPNLYLPINHTLTMLEQMDVFVCPDSGLIHAATALKKNIITFQSRILPEHVMHKMDNIHIIRTPNEMLDCKTNCSSRRMEKHMTNNVFYDRVTDLKPKIILDILEEFKIHSHLDCQGRFTVDCLEKVPVNKIVEKVEKWKQKKRIAED